MRGPQTGPARLAQDKQKKTREGEHGTDLVHCRGNFIIQKRKRNQEPGRQGRIQIRTDAPQIAQIHGPALRPLTQRSQIVQIAAATQAPRGLEIIVEIAAAAFEEHTGRGRHRNNFQPGNKQTEAQQTHARVQNPSCHGVARFHSAAEPGDTGPDSIKNLRGHGGGIVSDRLKKPGSTGRPENEMKNEAEMEAFLRPYRFDLPDELIASAPAPDRDGSRLLVLDRRSGALSDRLFRDLPELLRSGDLLIRNTTRVSRRRVPLRRASGAATPALFLEPAGEGGAWFCLVKNSKKLKNGEILPGPDGHTSFRFDRAGPTLTALNAAGAAAWRDRAAAETFFEKFGQMPLPPYLKRAAGPDDLDRYQTVYARETGSAAAPTAGLHFTPTLFEGLTARGVALAGLDLRIGYGTFAPLSPRNFAENALHPETYRVAGDFPLERLTPRAGTEPADGHSGRTIAVGTTTLRALEDNLRNQNGPRAGEFTTAIFLRPPDRCQSVDGLLTNFHLPGSSLLLLVSAFGGPASVLAAYRHAIRNRYRFYSYGDAMLIL